MSNKKSHPPAIDPLAVDRCLSRDRHAFQKSIQRWHRGQLNPSESEKLAQQLHSSVSAVEARRKRIPELHFPDLPVCDHIDEIQLALDRHQVVVISGETGSGKTTQLPKICLKSGRGFRGMVGHTQPRRIAARSVAERIAEECQRPLGAEIGYTVRFHDHTQPSTLVKLMTDGILLAETRRDPYLSAYDTLIVDEAHERSLNTDFLLGYLKWLLPKRPDLKLIITSATIDTASFAQHFLAPVIEVSGRTYPVECRYRPLHTGDGDTRDQLMAILDAVEELHRAGSGDILVFLSGERDIRDTAHFLQKSMTRSCQVLPLYGRLSAREQAEIFKPHQQRRVILATNVAETSLTVPGIRYVIDTGLARISRYSLRSKIQLLPIEPISQASAYQRAGRCGRVAPGICIRLYDEADFLKRAEFTEAEILRTNLAAVILQMKMLRLGEIEKFPFLESPEPKAIRSGIRLLQELNALDRSETLTPTGQAMARFPIEPRFARILIAANQLGSLTEACVLVAALSIQDPRERPSEKTQQADEKHRLFQDDRSDFVSLLKLWQIYQDTKKLRSKSGMRKFCRDHFLSFMRMCEWEDVWHQLVRIATRELKYKLNHQPADYQAIHAAILPGLLSQIGFKQDGYEYLGARNLKFHIHPGSDVRKKSPKWVVCAEQVETSRVFARLVAAVEPEWIERCAGHVLKRSYSEPYWSKKQGRAMILERVTVFGLTVVQGRSVALSPVDKHQARELFIRHALVEQDYATHAKFFIHNQLKLEQAGYLQHKQRRVDLVVDAEWLYEFYDQIIDDAVCDARSFDRWRKRVETDQPELLFLPEDRLVSTHAATLDTQDYPDYLLLNGTKFSLRYRFEPGAVDDGVTILIQIHQLNQIDPAPLSWLVPGLLRDKVIQLLRTLPKTFRRRIGPIPDFADKFLASSHTNQEQLTDTLHRQLRHELHTHDLPEIVDHELDSHLLMNIRLMEGDQVLTESRQLTVLQTKFMQQAKQEFQQKTSLQVKTPQQATPSTDWAFGDIPTEMQVKVDEQPLKVFPAIKAVDEGVVLSQMDTEIAAQRIHKQGVLKLLRLSLSSELRYLRKHLRPQAKLDVYLAQLPDHPFLASSENTEPAIEQIIERSLHTLFLDHPERVRSQPDFEHLLSRKSKLIDTANESAALFEKILKQHAECLAFLNDNALSERTREDIQKQLSQLVFKGFWQSTAWNYLLEYPRYHKGLERRFERLLQSPEKDLSAIAQVEQFEMPFWRELVANKMSLEAIQSYEFRWMLEEYRISLFSQPIKTKSPVSDKRLSKSWVKHLQEL